MPIGIFGAIEIFLVLMFLIVVFTDWASWAWVFLIVPAMIFFWPMYVSESIITGTVSYAEAHPEQIKSIVKTAAEIAPLVLV